MPETAWLIESRLGQSAEATFLRLITTGILQVIDLGLPSYARCVELIAQYADLGLGFVDASIVAVAENLGHHHARHAQQPGLQRCAPTTC